MVREAIEDLFPGDRPGDLYPGRADFSNDECEKLEDEARSATAARCGGGGVGRGSGQGREVEEVNEFTVLALCAPIFARQ